MLNASQLLASTSNLYIEKNTMEMFETICCSMQWLQYKAANQHHLAPTKGAVRTAPH